MGRDEVTVLPSGIKHHFNFVNAINDICSVFMVYSKKFGFIPANPIQYAPCMTNYRQFYELIHAWQWDVVCFSLFGRQQAGAGTTIGFRCLFPPFFEDQDSNQHFSCKGKGWIWMGSKFLQKRYQAVVPFTSCLSRSISLPIFAV